MPTRKIPKNACSVTGMVASSVNKRMVASESTLEQDFYILLEFNYGNHILAFEEQPVDISYNDIAGVRRKYTPDIRVIYRQDSSSNNLRPYIGEIKYRSDLFKNWKELKPKLKAGRAYAKAHGMDFKILTENEIRTPFLKNAKFLRQYKRLTFEHDQITTVTGALRTLGTTTPTVLLGSIYKDKWKQAEVTPILWNLVVNAQIGCDLNIKMTMEMPIWSL